MKKFLAVLLFLSSVNSYAAYDESIVLGRSSFTTTNDTGVYIQGTKPGYVLWAVVVSSPSPGGTLTLFDSSGTTGAGSRIAVLSLGTLGATSSFPSSWTVPFEVRLSSALTYTTAGLSSGVTIIYKATRP